MILKKDMEKYTAEEAGRMAQIYSCVISARYCFESGAWEYPNEEKRKVAKTLLSDVIPSYERLPKNFLKKANDGERNRPIDIDDLKKLCETCLNRTSRSKITNHSKK